MIFHNRGKHLGIIPNIIIKNTLIERVRNFNFLGININKNLSWVPHIDKISVKMSRCIGIISKLKHILPVNYIS